MDGEGERERERERERETLPSAVLKRMEDALVASGALPHVAGVPRAGVVPLARGRLFTRTRDTFSLEIKVRPRMKLRAKNVYI